jgi:hypothetical protein
VGPGEVEKVMGAPGRPAGTKAGNSLGMEVDGARPDHGGAATAGDRPRSVAAGAYGLTAAGSRARGDGSHGDAAAESPAAVGGGDAAWLGAEAKRSGGARWRAGRAQRRTVP